MTPEPLLSAPLVSRRRAVPPLLGRAAAITFVIAAYAVVTAAFLLANLMTVESVDPPKASSTPIEFHRPPAGGGGSTGGGSTGGPRRATAQPPAIHPPVPPPVVVPLAPPESTPASTPVSPIASANSAATGDEGIDGPGSGPAGDGFGPAGSGRPCPECPSGTGSGTQASSEEPILDGSRADITPPVLIAASRTIPKYPEMARLARVQGSVMLLVVIDRDGRVGAIEVLRSPDPRYGFDLSAIEAVKSWRYLPARQGGRPVAVQASVLIEFSLSR